MWKRAALILFITGSFSWAEKKVVGKFCETGSIFEYNYCSNEKGGKKKKPNYYKFELNTTDLQFMVKPSTALAVCLWYLSLSWQLSPCHHVLLSPPCCLTVANTAQAGQSSAAAALPVQTALAYLGLVLNSPSLGHFPSLGSCLLTMPTAETHWKCWGHVSCLSWESQ